MSASVGKIPRTPQQSSGDSRKISGEVGSNEFRCHKNRRCICRYHIVSQERASIKEEEGEGEGEAIAIVTVRDMKFSPHCMFVKKVKQSDSKSAFFSLSRS